MRLKIRSKLIIGIIVIIFVFGGSATYSVFELAKKEMLKQQKNSVELLIEESGNEIKQVFVCAKDLVDTIAKQDKIINFFTNPEKQNQELLSVLKSYNIGDNFSAIYLMDRNGDTWASTDESFVGKNYSFRTYFKKAIETKRSVVDVAVGVTSKQPGYYFASPIISSSDEVIGLVVAKMIPENVHNLFYDDSSRDNSDYMFVDNYGVIVYSNNEDRIYKSLGSLTEKTLLKIKEENKFPEIEIESIKYDLAQKVIDKYSGLEIIDFFDEADNEEEILAIYKIDDLPFFLINEIESDSLIDPVYKIALTLSFFILGAALMAALSISWLVNKFLNPLTKFKKLVSEITKGNLNKQINVDTSDELHDLASDFNKMIKKIKNAQEGSEKKIIERTGELEKMNSYMTGRELKMIELKEKIKKLETTVSLPMNKSWTDKFNEAVELEEGVIKQLEGVYVPEIKKINLDEEKKKKALKLIKKLVSDSKRHDKLFKKLIEQENAR